MTDARYEIKVRPHFDGGYEAWLNKNDTLVTGSYRIKDTREAAIAAVRKFASWKLDPDNATETVPL